MLVGVRNRKLDSKGTDNRTVEWIYGLKVKYGRCRILPHRNAVVLIREFWFFMLLVICISSYGNFLIVVFAHCIREGPVQDQQMKNKMQKGDGGKKGGGPARCVGVHSCGSAELTDQCGVNAWLGPPGPASGHSAPHPRFASAQTPLTGRTSHKHLLDDPELIPCMPCVHSTDKQTEALTGSMMWGRGPCSSNPEPTLDLVGLTPDTKDPEQ
ncbi:hypothetical protein MJT46_007084 [Ovis ammon polii x Ovis aries]|nr:hypothetical protein MJT46_007084 [Ovis ammon polii x Ovis aries]